jgi:hypothetical protein
VSAIKKPDPAADWRLAEKILEEEADKLATMSDEEFDQAMATLPDPPNVLGVDGIMARAGHRAGDKTDGQVATALEVALHPDNTDGAAKATQPASSNVRPLRPKRPNVFAWLAAAAVGAMALVIVLNRPPETVGHGRDADGGVVTPGDRAAKLRDEGLAACSRQLWEACEKRLDDAKQLDPDGEKEPRIVEARKAIARARRP